MSGRVFRNDVGAWFIEHPNVEATAHQIAQDLNLKPQQITKCVRDAIYVKTAAWARNIEVIATGRAWIYRNNTIVKTTQKSNALFEQLAETKNGTIIVQDESGNVFKIVSLD